MKLSQRLFQSVLAVLIALGGGAIHYAGAGQLNFSVQVDRNQISVDESVSLKLSIEVEDIGKIKTPHFSAPDFDVVNEFTSTFVQSYYDNGKFGAKNTHQITKVLRPRKTGNLTITELQVEADGKVYTSPPIQIQVGASGAGTPPPQNYGGSGVGLRGAGKRAPGRGFFLRAELDKQKAFKGEQIIVSFYLYRRVRVFQAEASRYPTFNGFLREDLEIPILQGRLDAEAVALDGVVYERSLVARFAAYPIKEGRLKIDPLSVKLNYQNDQRQMGQEGGDDVFMNLFSQLTPMTGTADSEPVYVEVLSLPQEGMPPSFSGGVGDFSVTSAVDKAEVKANEAVTVTVKVEGRGNVAAIEEPKAKWPDTVELYDSKGRAKTGHGGTGEKIFEFLLIPRTPGKLKLPGLEFSFFDPVKKQYMTRTSGPIDLTVLEGAPGSAQLPRSKSSTAVGAEEVILEIHGIKPLTEGAIPASSLKIHWTRGLILLPGVALLFLLGLGGCDWIRQRRQQQKRHKVSVSKSWQGLRSQARQVQPNGISQQELIQIYELLSGAVYDGIDRAYDLGARSLSRQALEEILVRQRALPLETWRRLSELLEYAEMIRFASRTGVVSELDARSQLEKWINEGQALEEEMKFLATRAITDSRG